jgi:N-methylhydantoinase B
MNMIYTALLSTVYYAVKGIVAPTTLANSGLSRPHRKKVSMIS